LENIIGDPVEELGVDEKMIVACMYISLLSFILPPAAVWNLVGGPITGIIPSRPL
jgi:hypothetical protein